MYKKGMLWFMYLLQINIVHVNISLARCLHILRAMANNLKWIIGFEKGVY